MRKQRKLSQLRAQFQNELRRDKLNTAFSQHRQALRQLNEKHDEEQFNKIYPTIDEQNLETHLPFILKYSYNQHYNYRLVVFAGYLYDYLLSHPDSQPVLDILQALSQFEQLELPQTQQLTEVLIQNLGSHCRTVLSIVANLLEHHKYSSGLRQHLLEMHFVQAADEALAKSKDQKLAEMHIYITSLYFEILCLMITTHPVVEDHTFSHIISKLQHFLAHEDLIFILFERLERLTSSVIQHKDRAAAIYQAFHKYMHKQYFNYEWEIVTILHYCLKSKVPFDKIFCPLLAKSLTSPNQKLKEKVILILERLEAEEERRQLVFSEQNFLINLLGVYEGSQEWTKQKILQLLEKIIREYLMETFKNTEMISESNHVYIIPRLCGILRDALQVQTKNLAESAIAVTLNLLLTLVSQELQGTAEMLAKMQQEGIFQQISKLEPTLNKQAREKVLGILTLLDEAKKQMNEPDIL